MKCMNCGTENPEGMKFCGECGTGLPQQPTEEKPQSTERPRYGFKINVLCLFGMVIAVVSLLLPWAEADSDYWQDAKAIGAFEFEEPLIGWGSSGYGWFPSYVQAFVNLFVIGAALCFATPLGAIPMTLGVGGFLLTLPGKVYIADIMPGIGVAAALLSAAMVILSFPKILTPSAWDEILTRRIDWWMTWGSYRQRP